MLRYLTLIAQSIALPLLKPFPTDKITQSAFYPIEIDLENPLSYYKKSITESSEKHEDITKILVHKGWIQGYASERTGVGFSPEESNCDSANDEYCVPPLRFVGIGLAKNYEDVTGPFDFSQVGYDFNYYLYQKYEGLDKLPSFPMGENDIVSTGFANEEFTSEIVNVLKDELDSNLPYQSNLVVESAFVVTYENIDQTSDATGANFQIIFAKCSSDASTAIFYFYNSKKYYFSV